MRIKRTIKRVVPGIDRAHEEAKYQEGPPPSPPNGVIISPDTTRDHRLPPGQARTRKWPILDAFGPPEIDLDQWLLEIVGLVEYPVTFTLEEFKSLPRVKVFADMHCVTRWSRLGNLWEGVSTLEIRKKINVLPRATHVLLHGFDGEWSTNVPIDKFFQEDCLLADMHDGMPITIEHGGPVRAVIPRLYAWKSAKWIRAIEFMHGDRPGFWESGAYHMHGDPWLEERFNDKLR